MLGNAYVMERIIESYEMSHFTFLIYQLGVCGYIVGEALYYKVEDHVFESQWGEWIFIICLILPAVLCPEVLSASNGN